MINTSGLGDGAQDRVNVLGVGINCINMQMALAAIREWATEDQKTYVCVCTVHTVMECQMSEQLRSIVNASGMSTPDGMPLVWLARRAGRRHVRRVYGPVLMLATLEQPGYRHFFYGGGPGVCDRLTEALKVRYPAAAIVGSLTPPVASIDELCSPVVADAINRANPDIVWVGISTPKQDMWMHRMRSALDAPVLIGVGAAFDFHAGLKRQAPKWMQRSGLEWLFRLLQEPRRLWKRYLIYNTWFVLCVTLQALGVRKYSVKRFLP